MPVFFYLALKYQKSVFIVESVINDCHNESPA
jgi:hypothetical protein